MKREDLQDAFGEIDEELIKEADALRSGQHKIKRHRPVKRVAAAAACVLLAVSAVMAAGHGSLPGTSQTVYAGEIAEAEYPEQAVYPHYTDSSFSDMEGDYDTWGAEHEERLAAGEALGDALDTYDRKVVSCLLTGEDDEDPNKAFSPVCLYMSLAMLAEVTDGNTRAQILELLGAEDISELQETFADLWKSVYQNDGVTSVICGNSLWMNEEGSYDSALLEELAEKFYVSSFSGQMGSDDYDQMVSEWISSQTGGLLEGRMPDVRFDESTVLALVSTLYFEAQWQELFNESSTDEGTFHGVSGDVTADFMHTFQEIPYVKTESWTAVCIPFESGGQMWFVLPDEGTDTAALAQDDDLYALMSGSSETMAENRYVQLSLPKFDLTVTDNLMDSFEALGLTDVMSPDAADFSALLGEDSGAYLSSARQSTRIMVDENGCRAASVVVDEAAGAGLEEPEIIELDLDRPFLFAVTGESGALLLTGILNQP